MAETNRLQGKKLLILGGADLHSELVRTAKRLGVETYVADFLPVDKAPAKQVADHAWELDITDCDAIVERCREEGIDGVLNMYYDPCQRPYQAICEKLGLPCCGSISDRARSARSAVWTGLGRLSPSRSSITWGTGSRLGTTFGNAFARWNFCLTTSRM